MRDIERTEPVNVAPGQWIIANENGTFRVSTTGPQTETANGLPQTYRSARTVRALLNGALYAVFGGRGRQGRRQPTSLTRLVYMLAGSYHHLQTPSRLARAAATFKDLKRDDIAAFLQLKVREESGHDRLALRDLDALGLPGQEIANTLRPPVSIRLLELLDSYSRRSYPMAVLGYTYCMERLAILYGDEDIDAYQALCPSGVDATRCLRVHSGVGADDEHVDELVDFVTTLDKSDISLVAAATCETASVMVDALLADAATTDADIAAHLQRGGIALPFAA
jgi:hypothetical protein